MGFSASFCHGSKIMFPSATFDATASVKASIQEKATVLHGVPTMFLAVLEDLKKRSQQLTRIRTGIAAGAPVPASLMERLEREMGVRGILIAYGMTETSPVTFMTSLDDSRDKMHASIGKVFPHTAAKVIDGDGNTVPRGARGGICTSGYSHQKGYWREDKKTAEVMKRDADGVLWMHTGDEGFIDDKGYGHVTGRIKDLIIRGKWIGLFPLLLKAESVSNQGMERTSGGENISPAEIEDHLLTHPRIKECCVVGLEDGRYGEVVSCFLRGTDTDRVSDQEVKDWVTKHLGRIKAPQHIFWIGEEHVGRELPRTGSGKYQKHLIWAKGNHLIKQLGGKQAKL